jgi:broad specificity phosphatase PhoE
MRPMPDLRGFTGTADFYFIRHGQSAGNRDGVIQGRQPSRLTEDGRSQARAAGSWFAGRGIQLIITSPLARAEETARIIGEQAGVADVRPREDLTELDTGLFSGLTFAQAETRHPVEWQAFQRQSWEAVPRAERIEQLLARAETTWEHLAVLAGQGVRSVLCVTHSGFMQWLIKCSLGAHRGWMPLFGSAGNCSVSHLRVTNTPLAGGGQGHLATWLLINAAVG